MTEPTNNPSPETPASRAEILASSEWVDALEAALRKLKDANEMPLSKGGDSYNRMEVNDTICVLQDIVDEERRCASTDEALRQRGEKL